jgi:hypothetical protein
MMRSNPHSIPPFNVQPFSHAAQKFAEAVKKRVDYFFREQEGYTDASILRKAEYLRVREQIRMKMKKIRMIHHHPSLTTDRTTSGKRNGFIVLECTAAGNEHVIRLLVNGLGYETGGN